MIAETIIISIAAVTIVGTIGGLRFAAHEMGLVPKSRVNDDERKSAMADTEHHMKYGNREYLRALLAVRGEHLPQEIRERAQAWLDERH